MKQFYEHKKIYLVILLGLIIFYLSGCSSGNAVQPLGPTYPISSDVQTTRQRIIVPDPVPSGSPQIYPYQVELYSQYGYGRWHYDPPVYAGKRIDIMGAGYNSVTVTNTARLLNFFTITDIHICDKESPATSIYFGYKGGSSSSFSAVMLYTTQVLDAAVQTINALHRKNPFDFGMSLGDACDNTQYNELRWFMDVIDGKVITPSSGNHAGAETIDYQKPYQAAGLDKTISWYQVLGNHDHFWKGSWPVNDYVRQTYIGLNILNLGSPITAMVSMGINGYYMGAIDGRTPYGDIMGVGPAKDFTSPPQVLAADQNRRSLSRNEWISEFFNTSSNPVGHGFSQSNVQTGFACYSFKPKASVPIKVIVLDDTQREDGPHNGPYVFGYLDQERYTWLVEELDKGQAAGELMIVAAHVPIGVYASPTDSTTSIWSTVSPISQDTLIAKLHTYPNLLMWIAGHRHCNAVTAFQSPDNSRPELGFWGVETSSLRDYPRNFRTFDIALNSDNTISIIITDVDPAVAVGSPAATSLSYAVASEELFNSPIGYLPSGTYNAELLKQLSPDMQVKISKCGTPIK